MSEDLTSMNEVPLSELSWESLSEKKPVLSQAPEDRSIPSCDEIRRALGRIGYSRESRVRVFHYLQGHDELAQVASDHYRDEWPTREEYQDALQDEILSTVLVASSDPWSVVTFAAECDIAGAPAGDEEWELPTPLTSTDAEPPTFPTGEVFKTQPVFGDYVKSVALALQTDTGVVALAAVVTISSTIIQKFNVRTPTHTEDPAMWGLCLQSSGERKSALLTEIMRPLKEWNEDVSAAAAIAAAEYRDKIDAHKKRTDFLLKELAKLEGNKFTTCERKLADHQKEVLPEQPIDPDYRTSDGTSEALAKMLGRTGERVFLAAAEPTPWRNLAGGRYNDGKVDVNLINGSYCGDAIQQIRVTRSSVHLKHPLVCYLQLAQPKILADSMTNPLLVDTGHVSRFLKVLTKSERGFLEVRNTPEVCQRGCEDYGHRVKELLAIDPGNPVTIRMTEDAKEMYIVFREENEKRQRQGGDLHNEEFAYFARRRHGHLARTALVFHVFRHALETEIPLEIDAATMLDAIDWMEFFTATEIFIDGSLAVSPDVHHAIKALAWIKANDCGEMLQRAVFDGVAAKGYTTMADFSRPWKILEDHEYVRLEKQPPGKKGGRPRVVVKTNPLWRMDS